MIKKIIKILVEYAFALYDFDNLFKSFKKELYIYLIIIYISFAFLLFFLFLLFLV